MRGQRRGLSMWIMCACGDRERSIGLELRSAPRSMQPRQRVIPQTIAIRRDTHHLNGAVMAGEVDLSLSLCECLIRAVV